jgi:hypothetical protein
MASTSSANWSASEFHHRGSLSTRWRVAKASRCHVIVKWRPQIWQPNVMPRAWVRTTAQGDHESPPEQSGQAKNSASKPGTRRRPDPTFFGLCASNPGGMNVQVRPSGGSVTILAVLLSDRRT